MAKEKVIFECQACGTTSPKWMGKCTNCGAWDSFVELSKTQKAFLQSTQQLPSQTKAIQITEVKEEHIHRFSSGDSELDAVLGGGIVSGSLVLIGGSPGVGKSTLMLKTAGNLASMGKKVLYVSGEESAGQIKMRSTRLEAHHQNLFLLTEIDLSVIKPEMACGYDAIIIDSIQTLFSPEVGSAPGSVSQVREITFELMRFAKHSLTPIFIIGHITKEGSIAGPRILEHMVDTVLYFDGDANKELRLLRSFKNRFGSTSEVGIFEMTKVGLVSAKDISRKFFGSSTPRSGSALTVILEGSRPLVVEVQALVAQSYGNPKRSATGFDNNRLGMLLALLERKLELPFNQYDVFVNIVGGIKINETSADLALLAAIISSFRSRPVSQETIFLGEVSLIGDIREVYNLETRLKEAKAQGFTKMVVPKKPSEIFEELKLFEADEVTKLLEWM